MRNNKTLALVLEVSRGCARSCTGCKINKQSGSIPSEDTLVKLLKLTQDMKLAGVDFYEVELGPTDLTTAANTGDIFANEYLQSICRMFKVTTINGSFIDPNPRVYEDFAKKVNAFTPDNWIGLAIPVEMRHVFNDKYISRIRDNVKAFEQVLPNIIKEVVVNIIFDEKYMEQAAKEHTYEELFARCNSLDVHENTMADFVFHHGRVGRGESIDTEAFKRAIAALNEQYLLEVRRRGKDASKRFLPSQMIPESHNTELILSEGELYVRPILNERTTVFHERFRHNGEWDYHSVTEAIANRFIDNFAIAASANMEDCNSCEFLSDCAEGSVQDLMEVLKTNKCILIKRELSQ